MFLAGLFFAILLVGVLIVAFFRFREPPRGAPTPITTSSAPASPGLLVVLHS